jgi:innexin
MDIFNSARCIWNIKYVNTSNNVFKLHGKFTVMLALVFSILVSARQYFGDPIDCFVSNKEDKSSIENFCWIIGTYTNKNGYHG